jgi:hypothetical protein
MEIDIFRRKLHSKTPDERPVEDYVIMDKEKKTITYIPILELDPKTGMNLPIFYAQVSFYF